jgi:copper(I)-binding protein
MSRLAYILIGLGLGLAAVFIAVSRDTGGDLVGAPEVEGGRGDAVVEVDGLAVFSPWARPATLLAGDPSPVNSSAYLTITSSQLDRLVGVESQAARSAEVHETRAEDGIMRMGPADPGDLAVGPGRSLEMRPGGLHIMLMGLQAPLVDGDTVRIDLLFESGARLTVPAPVGHRRNPED